jgi:hypothetical protein
MLKTLCLPTANRPRDLWYDARHSKSAGCGTPQAVQALNYGCMQEHTTAQLPTWRSETAGTAAPCANVSSSMPPTVQHRSRLNQSIRANSSLGDAFLVKPYVRPGLTGSATAFPPGGGMTGGKVTGQLPSVLLGASTRGGWKVLRAVGSVNTAGKGHQHRQGHSHVVFWKPPGLELNTLGLIVLGC